MKTADPTLGMVRLRQAGVTLIEALVALLIMGFGMVALLGLQSTMRHSADLARQRSEAVRLAQRDIEMLRAFATLDSFAAIADSTALDIGDADSNAEFRLDRKVTASPDGSWLDVTATVSWVDRADVPVDVSLRSLIARIDPRLSGALAIAPDGAPTRRPLGRHIAIPPGATKLGERSVFKPPALSSGIAWVFDNRSGLIVMRCVGLDPDIPAAKLTEADVEARCGSISAALLISGTVRFSTAGSPDPVEPGDAALPLDLWIDAADTSTPAPAHECFDNAPASASTAMSDGVLYYCAVFPAGGWSGRVLISGIALGAGGHKICRYSADYDGDGRISNPEHPDPYLAVISPLARQNFLVIDAAHQCPGAGQLVNSGTLLHQS